MTNATHPEVFMRRSIRRLLSVVCLSVPVTAGGQPKPAVTVETTLKVLDEEPRASLKNVPAKQGEATHLDPKGPPTFRYHNVPEGTADVLAKLIPSISLNSSVRCAPFGSKKLFMYADPTTHSIVQTVIGTMYFVQIVADECRPIIPRVR
jgi:hypothetical protein